jgi:hypothetical protein
VVPLLGLLAEPVEHHIGLFVDTVGLGPRHQAGLQRLGCTRLGIARVQLVLDRIGALAWLGKIAGRHGVALIAG